MHPSAELDVSNSRDFLSFSPGTVDYKDRPSILGDSLRPRATGLLQLLSFQTFLHQTEDDLRRSFSSQFSSKVRAIVFRQPVPYVVCLTILFPLSKRIFSRAQGDPTILPLHRFSTFFHNRGYQFYVKKRRAFCIPPKLRKYSPALFLVCSSVGRFLPPLCRLLAPLGKRARTFSAERFLSAFLL